MFFRAGGSPWARHTPPQVKVKCRPLDVAFGGKQDQDECIVSVNMDGRTILLYNLHDQENALELAFQVRLGLSCAERPVFSFRLLPVAGVQGVTTPAGHRRKKEQSLPFRGQTPAQRSGRSI